MHMHTRTLTLTLTADPSMCPPLTHTHTHLQVAALDQDLSFFYGQLSASGGPQLRPPARTAAHGTGLQPPATAATASVVDAKGRRVSCASPTAATAAAAWPPARAKGALQLVVGDVTTIQVPAWLGG